MRTAIAASLASAVLALVLFAWLADEVFEGDVARLDSRVRIWIHLYASPSLTSAMFSISEFGSLVLVLLFVFAFVAFVIAGWRRGAAWLLLTMAGATVLDLTLKYAYHRPRPTPFFGPVPATYSFPSGHALFSFCFYTVLAGQISARIRSVGLRILVWMMALVLVTAIGFSRIYLGVHYPSDVLAGYLAASVWVSTLVGLDRLRRRRVPQVPAADAGSGHAQRGVSSSG